MTYAIFSDVHGNLVNLQDFFECAQFLKVDQYVCLGDVCNYYPDTLEVIDAIIERNVICIQGNHDLMYTSSHEISGEKKKQYNYSELIFNSYKHISFLSSLTSKLEVTMNSSVLFCHGSPLDVHEYVYPDSDLSKFSNVPNDIIFMGHTHRQFIKEINGKVFCNVGSIGMPRDNGSLFGFVLFDSDSNKIELCRMSTNVTKVLSKYSANTPNEVLKLMNRTEPLTYKYTLYD
ncbi:MAG: metallophosphoesterase family protein [Cyclobacteriaceae bacterium]